jgi:ATP-binding protein involved in chromosome partitioning
VKHIVAVASGKGGVGKSTVSAMLALGFRELGVKTALIDADIYGPSQATIFGVHEKPKGSANGEKILPVVAHGISLMSFSFFIDPHQPAVWRGPVVMKVLEQFFFDVAWPESDVLLIDLPPGTGDIQLSMIQYVPLAGALMVTTPQHLSVLDAIKGGNMFHKLNVPVLGVVENMSKFVCPDCGGHHALFRHGGGEAAADQLSCPLLVRFPLNPTLCDYLDIGRVDLAFQLPAVKDLALELATQVLAKLPSAT